MHRQSQSNRRQFLKRAGIFVPAAFGILPASAQMAFPRARGFRYPAAAPSVTYIINENCEGTGTPSGWSNTGTPDWDYTGATLEGSQCLQLDATEAVYYDITPQASFTMVAMVRVTDATPSGVCNLFSLRHQVSETVDFNSCLARLSTSGALTVYAWNGDSSATSDTLSDNTNYYIKLVYNNGGTCSVEFSTTNSFSGSGSKFTSRIGGTTDPNRVFLGYSNTTTSICIDDVKLSTSNFP